MNDDFDLKKYRNENNMDYLKAIELIRQEPSNTIIQEAIYKITRLHIPDKIYKYFSFNENEELNKIKLDTIRNKKIYLAESSAMNDPFDCKAFFYDNKKLIKYERLAHCEGRIIDDFSDFVRIASFTEESINCMPMWAHYSNNHTGFCIEYDTNQNKHLKECLFPVQYTNKRIDITDIIDETTKEIVESVEENIKKNIKVTKINNLTMIWMSIYFSCIKHKSWSYEKEIRCIVSKTSTSYMDAKPSAIYMGINCNDFRKKELFDIAYEFDIPLYQLTFNEKSYNYDLSLNKIR